MLLMATQQLFDLLLGGADLYAYSPLPLWIVVHSQLLSPTQTNILHSEAYCVHKLINMPIESCRVPI